MNNKKYNLKKLIKKYNKILNEKYGTDDDILEESIKGALDSIESLQYDCWTDNCDTWKECDYIKKYLYFKYIEKDIKDLEKVVL